MPWKPLEDPDPGESAAFVKAFRKKARFLVDEDLGIGVTQYLRDAGWNVRDVHEIGLSRREDPVPLHPERTSIDLGGRLRHAEAMWLLPHPNKHRSFHPCL